MKIFRSRGLSHENQPNVEEEFSLSLEHREFTGEKASDAAAIRLTNPVGSQLTPAE
ncbi:MAG: hypothetical protein HYR56_17650 [Acidobacteria bacterium]|nr:hypothetical protein [Acidobacteriota bacterium]MBI3426532.1 hypothetical protein [Acidobacteriota bacterium]